jgi:hypothetical protein
MGNTRPGHSFCHHEPFDILILRQAQDDKDRHCRREGHSAISQGLLPITPHSSSAPLAFFIDNISVFDKVHS